MQQIVFSYRKYKNRGFDPEYVNEIKDYVMFTLNTIKRKVIIK